MQFCGSNLEKHESALIFGGSNWMQEGKNDPQKRKKLRNV
jgi:hypothetical protein